MALKKDLILFARIDEPGLGGIDVYRRAYDGYKAVEKVLGGKVAPARRVQLVHQGRPVQQGQRDSVDFLRCRFRSSPICLRTSR